MSFRRSISTWGLLFAAVGGMIGSGRLFGPYFAAQIAGPASIFAWLIGGVLMIIVALTFAELSSSFPLTGGSIRFLQLSHGSVVSFNMAWIAWISCIAVAPIETLALLHYASHYFPSLMHEVQNVNLLTSRGMMVAAVLMLLMCWINGCGAQKMTKVNNILVLIKLTVSFFTIIVLFCLQFEPSNFTAHGMAPYGLHGILAALPSAGIIFSYIGYSPAIQLAGEAKNPQRSLPIAIIGALFICIALYILLQVAFIGALKPTDYAHGWARLSFNGDGGPLVGLVMSFGLAWFVKVMMFDASISPFGTALLYTGSTARMCYAMGDNGYLPKKLMRLNKHGVPLRIIALDFFLGLLLFLPFPTWQTMMSFLVAALVFAYAVGPLALVVLRKTLPDHPRPFALPKPRWLCLLAFYICNLIVYWTGWGIVSKIVVVIAAGYIGLFVASRFKWLSHLTLKWAHSLWLIAHVALLGGLSYCGTFGGGHEYVSFGIDAVVMAVISVVIYEWALRSALSKEEVVAQGGY